jgi:hypothetical protein
MATTKSKTHRNTTSQDIPALTPQEYVVWVHALESCEPDGTFQQRSKVICEALNAKRIVMIPRSTQLLLKSLKRKGYLLEIEATHRDARGWPVPAKYRVVREFKGNNLVILGGGLRNALKVGGR